MSGVSIKLKKKTTYKKSVVLVEKFYKKKIYLPKTSSANGNGGIGLDFLYKYGL